MHRRKNREQGFALIMVALCVFGLFGLLGLAFDVGRMYIHKSEAMTYVDAAAVAAARELNGFPAGGLRAETQALQTWARWNFSSTDFASPVVEFSVSKYGPWFARTDILSWVGVGHARVTVTVNNVALYFLPVVGTGSTGSVAHLAVAGQILSAPLAIFPFSPVAHADIDLPSEVTGLNADYGFIKGGKYTFRWPNDPYDKNAELCPDDDNAVWKTKVDAGSSGWRGYITSHSAAVIRDEITSDLLGSGTVPDLGEPANQYGGNGNKGTEANAMEERVNSDTDHVTQEYYYEGVKPAGIVGAGSAWVSDPADSYLWRQLNSYAPYGNNQRIVTVIVNAGYADSTGTPLGATAYNSLGYAQFFLYELTYQATQHDAFCAEYIGNNPCQGCQGGTALPGDGSGQFIIRLEQ